jgi:type IV secretion system protein VirB6
MAWGYLMLTGRIEEPVAAGVKRIVTLAVVLGVGLHLWLYNTLLVDTFYRAPAELAAEVVGAPDPIRTLDAIWNQGGEVASLLYDKSTHWWNGLGFCIAGVAVWLLVGLLCIYTMFLLALSSVALSVLLALGPLFIVLFLFDATRRLFEAWIAQLANYALITILTVMVAALMLHLVASYARQTAALGSAIDTVDALDLLLVTVLVFLFMRQVMPIAAGLAGGVALATFGLMGRTLGWGARKATFGATNIIAPGVAVVGGALLSSARERSRQARARSEQQRPQQGVPWQATAAAGDSWD